LVAPPCLTPALVMETAAWEEDAEGKRAFIHKHSLIIELSHDYHTEQSHDKHTMKHNAHHHVFMQTSAQSMYNSASWAHKIHTTLHTT
jgi:hypothetical protein